MAAKNAPPPTTTQDKNGYENKKEQLRTQRQTNNIPRACVLFLSKTGSLLLPERTETSTWHRD